MRALIILAFSLFLSACGSIHSAGVAEYTFRPMVIDQQTICCEVTIKNGKEYASLKAKVVKRGDDYSVELDEQTVRAFDGQEKAADVVTKAVETAGTLGAAAIIGPSGIGALGTGIKAVVQ